MFRKIFVFMLCAALCVSLCACGNSDKQETADNSSAGTAAAVTAEPVVTPEPFEPIDWETVAENPATDFTYQIFDDSVQIDTYVGTGAVVRIPATIEGLPVMYTADDIFMNNTTITHVYLPDELKYMGECCFLGCTSLKQVRLSEETYDIPRAAFSGCSELRVINIPASVRGVGKSAFSNCSLITEAVFSDNLKNVDSNAFEYCTSLTKVSLPSASLIGQMAFLDCTALTDLTIFGGCSTFNGNAFIGCTALQTVTLTAVPENYSYSYLVYENGVLYSTYDGADGMTAMRMCPGTPVDELVLRDDTVDIEHSAFYGCQMKSVIIPASVRSIEGVAFKACPNLETFVLQEGSELANMSGGVFEHNPVLKTVDLSATDNEIMIWSNSFFLVESLEKVALPANAIIDGPLSELLAYSPNVVVTFNGTDYASDKLDEVPVTVETY